MLKLSANRSAIYKQINLLLDHLLLTTDNERVQRQTENVTKYFSFFK